MQSRKDLRRIRKGPTAPPLRRLWLRNRLRRQGDRGEKLGGAQADSRSKKTQLVVRQELWPRAQSSETRLRKSGRGVGGGGGSM